LLNLDRDIKKGEELTVSYAPKLNNHYPFRSYCCQSMGFECECELCEVDRADLELTIEREALVTMQSRKLHGKQGFNLDSMQRFVDGIESSYTDNRPAFMKTSLYTALSMLQFVHSQRGDLAKAAELTMRRFEMGELILESRRTNALLHAIKRNKQMGRLSESQQQVDLFMDYFVGDHAYLTYILALYF
jgi:hypothetical protein